VPPSAPSPPAAAPPVAPPAPATVIPPIPASLPASAPAPTLVAEPSQLSNDEAIAALIFPEPPRPAGSPPPEPLPPPVPTAVPVAVSLPPFVTAATAPKSDPGAAAATESASPPVHMPESEPKTKIEATATAPAAEFAADLAAAASTAPAVSLPTAKAEPLQLQAFQLPQEPSKDSKESLPTQEKSAQKDESDKTPAAPQATLNSNLEITGQHSGGKINVADNNGKPSLEKESAEAKRNIAQSLKGLFDSVDGAISGLTAIGLEAMHSDDIETVGAVMKQTKALKSLRESVVTLSKDWQKTID